MIFRHLYEPQLVSLHTETGSTKEETLTSNNLENNNSFNTLLLWKLDNIKPGGPSAAIHSSVVRIPRHCVMLLGFLVCCFPFCLMAACACECIFMVLRLDG